MWNRLAIYNIEFWLAPNFGIDENNKYFGRRRKKKGKKNGKKEKEYIEYHFLVELIEKPEIEPKILGMAWLEQKPNSKNIECHEWFR